MPKKLNSYEKVQRILAKNPSLSAKDAAAKAKVNLSTYYSQSSKAGRAGKQGRPKQALPLKAAAAKAKVSKQRKYSDISNSFGAVAASETLHADVVQPDGSRVHFAGTPAVVGEALRSFLRS